MNTRRPPILTIADARKRSARILPKALFEYIDGGSDDEVTLHENERAFRDLQLLPRMGRDVEPVTETTVLGHRLQSPILLAPAGMVQLVHPDGAIGVAKAAAEAGTISVLSRTALCLPADVSRHSSGPHWYQITSTGGRETVKSLIDAAAKAGFTGLVVTMDGPPPGKREAELRNGLVPPVTPSLALFASLAWQIASRPKWSARMFPTVYSGLPLIASTKKTLTSAAIQKSLRFSWADVEWLKREWPGHVLLKGIMTGADAIAARNAGADAVIVSNHGGRALDGVPATITVLPEIVDAVGSTMDVLVDGGIRRSTSVVKALCLGAKAVMIGRPFIYGLACAGQPGVKAVLDIFQSDLVRMMKLLGCPTIAELDRRWIYQGHGSMKSTFSSQQRAV